MRQQLDIYASLVLCKTLPGFPTRHKDVDFAIIRENTEGEYSGLEHQVSRCGFGREDEELMWGVLNVSPTLVS